MGKKVTIETLLTVYGAVERSFEERHAAWVGLENNELTSGRFAEPKVVVARTSLAQWEAAQVLIAQAVALCSEAAQVLGPLAWVRVGAGFGQTGAQAAAPGLAVLIDPEHHSVHATRAAIGTVPLPRRLKRTTDAVAPLTDWTPTREERE